MLWLGGLLVLHKTVNDDSCLCTKGKLKTLRHGILFIVLFALSCTNQKKSNYLNSHGEEA